jgi:hypothetical protein
LTFSVKDVSGRLRIRLRKTTRDKFGTKSAFLDTQIGRVEAIDIRLAAFPLDTARSR